MLILPWRAKRQLLYFSVFAFTSLAIVGGLIFYLSPKPTCFDGRQNQGEENIDCGEPCTPCLIGIKEPIILWTRIFESRKGIYDAAVLVENLNLLAGIQSLKYKITIYDAGNIIIAEREGETFLNPAERRIIFEGDFPTGTRVPKYAYIEFEQKKNWKYIKKEKSFLSVLKKDFVNFPFPRLSAEIKNELFLETKNISVSAVLYDNEGNVAGVSITKIDVIPPEATRPALFTWPAPFLKDPAAIEIIATIDLTRDNNIR